MTESSSAVFMTRVGNKRIYVAADGPGHAAFQILGLLPDLKNEAVARQVWIHTDRGWVIALGQAARDAARDISLPVVTFKLQKGGTK